MKKNTKIDQLPVKLTEKERLLKSMALAQTLKFISSLEDEKKAATAELNVKIKYAKGDAAKVAHEIRTGEETRDVQVFERPLYDVRKVETVRVDTGDVVSVRGMHPSELQQSLDDLPAPRNPGAERLRREAQKADKPEKAPKLPKGKLATLGEIATAKAKKTARKDGKTKPHVKSAPKAKKGPLTKKFEELAKPVKNPELERAAAELRHMDN